MTATWGWRLVRVALAAGAATGLCQHALLLARGELLTPMLLPMLALSLLAAATWPRRPGRDVATATTPSPPAANRWLLAATWVVLATCAGALTYGAIATSDRSWDGIVAWGLKAQALQATPSLAQPLFADATILHHSPDYPLLQPILLADLAALLGPQGARLLFPAMWALLVAIVAGVVRRHGRSGNATCLAALAVGTLPCFVNSGCGTVDSGYADLLMALVVLAGAAALVDDDPRLLFAAAMMLPWSKPEGTVVLVGLATVCFVACRQRLLWATLLGGSLGLALWLPLQIRLGYGAASPWLAPGVLALAGSAGLSRCLLDRRGMRTRGRAVLLGALAVAALVALLAAQPSLAGTNSTLLSHYLGSLSRIPEKLPMLPTIASSLLEFAARPNRFGLTLVALVLALLAATRRTDRGGARLAPLAGWLALGITTIVAAFLLSPETDVAHHLRSSAGRLLSHWAGATWLLIALTWSPAPSAPEELPTS